MLRPEDALTSLEGAAEEWLRLGVAPGGQVEEGEVVDADERVGMLRPKDRFRLGESRLGEVDRPAVVSRAIRLCDRGIRRIDPARLVLRRN